MKNLERNNRASAAAMGFIAASLIFIVLSAAVTFSVHPPALDQERADTIYKALAEIHKTENDALNNAGWQDQSRGLVRLPIATAMEIMERTGQNSTAFRDDLTAREEKASAPAPVAPAKPSAFE